MAGEVYGEIDALRELRALGIRQEMRYARAQAGLHGVDLPREVLEGYDLMAMPPLELLRQVPSLGIYRHFMWLGRREGETKS